MTLNDVSTQANLPLNASFFRISIITVLIETAGLFCETILHFRVKFQIGLRLGLLHAILLIQGRVGTACPTDPSCIVVLRSFQVFAALLQVQVSTACLNSLCQS